MLGRTQVPMDIAAWMFGGMWVLPYGSVHTEEW